MHIIPKTENIYHKGRIVLFCLTLGWTIFGQNPEPPRVVSMAPALTEICFAIGAGGHVIGVTDFCTYPVEVDKRVRVGGFLNPNLEKIVILKPDMVLLVPEQRTLAEQLRKLGVKTLTVRLSSLKDIAAAIRQTGSALNCAAAAEAKAGQLEVRLRELAVQRNGKRPGALLIVGRNPGDLSGLYVAGPTTFLGELLERAGGHNAYAGPIAYPTLSVEGVAAADPEVVIELWPGKRLTSEQKQRLAADWDRLPWLAAVRNRRVFILDQNYVSIPGPRVVETLALFKKCLSGEVQQ